MIKAIITKGVIVPFGPLPEGWQDGMEVTVEKFAEVSPAEGKIHPADSWMDEVETIARNGDPEDDRRLEAAMQEILRREKELARMKLGKCPQL
jgi:hypothetical protein